MSVPKQRHTKQRRDRKRKGLAVRIGKFIKCSKCSVSILPHRACPKCGYYKGREIVDTLKKSKKKSKKSKR